MRKTSIFFLGYFIFEFPVLKLTQVYIFNSIWRFLHGKVRLNYSKKGNFRQAPPAPQIKIFKKGKIHTYRIISSFGKKSKNLCIGLKLVKISCPNWMWLVFLMFDSFMYNWWGRRQIFFLGYFIFEFLVIKFSKKEKIYHQNYPLFQINQKVWVLD